jgi:hypothetical protein
MPSLGLRRPSFWLATGFLCLATWLYGGYVFGVNPQPTLLIPVLRLTGALKGDFYGNLPPLDWALAHAFGVLPTSWVQPAFLVAWLLSLGLLWAGFLAALEALGVDLLTALAAGLVAVPTSLAGLAVTFGFTSYFYPTSLSFAFGVVGLACVLRGRMAWAGASLGLATVCHPHVGLLMAVVIGVAAVLIGSSHRRALGRFALGYLPIAALPIAKAVIDSVAQSGLTADERFGLLVYVRAPHHYIYSQFPTVEYVQVGAWLCALAVGFVVLRRDRVVRALVASVGVVLAMCLVAALAAEHGGPFLFVQARPQRAVPLVILIALLVCAAAWHRVATRLAAAGMLAIAWAGPWLYEWRLDAALPNLSLDGLFGIAMAVGTAASALLGAVLIGRQPSRRRHLTQLSGAAAAVLLVLLTVSLVRDHAARTRSDDPLFAAYVDAAEQARHLSPPGAVWMVPPDLDGFPMLSHRAEIVEWSANPFGKGDREYVHRVDAVTQDPTLMDPDLRVSAARRSQLIAAAYDRAVVRSKTAICRYGATYVMTRKGLATAAWLEPIGGNADFDLARVRSNAC